MSFVRFGEDGSDVYIYADVVGEVRCCFCPLADRFGGSDYGTRHFSLMVEHIRDHREAGHHVPDWVERGMDERWPDFGQVGAS
ncbi:MAG TPA: hypothetical protein VF174_15770 [Micromonosporaceae bacterium]